MNGTAKADNVFFKLSKIRIKIADGLFFDLAGAVAQRLAVRQFSEQQVAFNGEPGEHAKPRLQSLVLHGYCRVLNE